MQQYVFGNVPAAVYLSQHLVLWNLHIVHEGFAEGRRARDEPDRPGGNTRRPHVEHQHANAAIATGRVGAHQAEDPVRLVRIARPYLLAVDKPVIALVIRTALKTDDIRTGARQ